MLALDPEPREALSRAPHISWLLYTTTTAYRHIDTCMYHPFHCTTLSGKGKEIANHTVF